MYEDLPLMFQNKYETYSADVEDAYAKLFNGTYSLFESRESLRYLIRSRFTNKYGIKFPFYK